MTRKLVLFPFLAVVLLAPLPFASNRPWSWALLSLLVGGLVILETLSSGGTHSKNSRFINRMMPGLILFCPVVIWLLIQMTGGFQTDMAHPLWLEITRLDSFDVEPTITLNTEATMGSLTRLISYCGVFWIAARLARNSENANFMLKAFVTASCIYAVYGLIVYFADLKSVLWYEKWAYRNDLTSTFVNRNSYATFAGIGLISSVALLFQLLGRKLRGHHTRRAMLLDLADRAFRQAWLPILGMFLTAFALLLTHSRGGLLSTGVGLIVLLLALSYAKIVPRKTGVLFISVVLSFSILAFVLAGNTVDVRLANTSFDTSARDELFTIIIEAIPSNPYFGTGYGTFESAFMAFKTYFLSNLNWDKAHNSYLELGFELGIPATIAIVGLFLWVAGVFVYGLVHRNRRQVFAAIGISTTALVGAHAIVDFSLQIPGFTVCYVLLIGIAWAQSWSTPRRTPQVPGAT